MKPERVLQPALQFVINSECGGKHGTKRLVAAEGTPRGAVSKKFRNVFEVADVNVAVDGVHVIEMKCIVKMVGVNDKCCSDNGCEQN